MKETKRERSVDEKIYASTMKNPDIELENVIVDLNDYIL